MSRDSNPYFRDTFKDVRKYGCNASGGEIIISQQDPGGAHTRTTVTWNGGLFDQAEVNPQGFTIQGSFEIQELYDSLGLFLGVIERSDWTGEVDGLP